MKKILLFLLVFSFVFLGEINATVSLVISQCKEGEGICDTQKIVKYTFNEGNLVNDEELLTIATNDVRFDLGRNFIYQNRFILNEWGDVFDIASKNIIYRSNGEYVNILDNKLITRVNRTDDEGFYSFDLFTKTSKKLRSLKGFPERYTFKFSANDKLIAESKMTPAGKTKFIFYTIDNRLNIKKKKVVDGKFSSSVSEIANEFAKVHFTWIDNESILTQQQNGEIIRVYLNGKIEPVVKINIEDAPDSSPRFGKHSSGKFYYSCNEDYLIDLKSKTYISDLNDILPLSNGFSVRSERDFWKTYYFGEKPIGRIWSSGTMSYKGYLAIFFAREGKNLGYPDGMKVWSEVKGDWITIENDWSPNFIGWLEE